MEPAAKQPDEQLDRRDDGFENAYRRSIYGVPVTLTVSVGQKTMSVADLLDLTEDAVVPLTSAIEDPVDLSINDKVIARGELIEGEGGTLAVKIIEIVDR